MKALLIQHKKAGDGLASPKALTRAIEAAGWKVAYLTRRKADAEAIAEAKADLVAVAGGDGTVAKIVKRLPDRSVPLAIIPCGTANNIARALGICGDFHAAIADWDAKRRRRLDVGAVEGPWGRRRFVEGVGFGAFAEWLRQVTEREDKDERPNGRQALRDALGEAAPLPLQIEVDGEPIGGELLLVEVMNVAMSGPRLPLAPDARPGGGLLHASWLPASRRAAMIRWLDKRKGDPPLEQRTGREIRVTGGGVTMRIDDGSRWLEPESEVAIRLEGEPVQILAPAGAPALAG
jgi:diacylglycerol kinase family enzyme